MGHFFELDSPRDSKKKDEHYVYAYKNLKKDQHSWYGSVSWFKIWNIFPWIKWANNLTLTFKIVLQI